MSQANLCCDKAVFVWNAAIMAALTQHRCLAGTKAFTGLQKQSQPRIANGSKYFMRRRDSYMVIGRSSEQHVIVAIAIVK